MSDDGTYDYGGDVEYEPPPSRLITNEDLPSGGSPYDLNGTGGPTTGREYNPNYAGGRGSDYSTYTNQWNSSGSPDIPMPTSRGTPPTPARQGSFSAPALPPPQFQRLTDLLADPSKITSDPAYKFLLEQGQSMLARRAAAQKMTGSGKADVDAIQFGQGSAMQYFNQIIQQLLAAGGLDVSRYGASRFQTSGGVGADPGTQGEFAARDLLPTVMRLLNPPGRTNVPMPSLPQVNQNYGGNRPAPASSGSGEEDYYAMLADMLGDD